MKKMRIIALLVAVLMILAMGCTFAEKLELTERAKAYIEDQMAQGVSYEGALAYYSSELWLDPYVHVDTPKLGDSSASIGSLIALSALTLTGVIVAEKKRRA